SNRTERQEASAKIFCDKTRTAQILGRKQWRRTVELVEAPEKKEGSSHEGGKKERTTETRSKNKAPGRPSSSERNLDEKMEAVETFDSISLPLKSETARPGVLT